MITKAIVEHAHIAKREVREQSATTEGATKKQSIVYRVRLSGAERSMFLYGISMLFFLHL